MLRQIGLAVAGPLALAGWSVAPAFASSGPYTNGELVRLEGFILSAEAEALFSRYIHGELTRSQLNDAVQQLAYGPSH